MLLLHGPTRQRAESILKNGPDARFREPHGPEAEGFSTSLATGPFEVGSPQDYARKKSANFPNEGGPVVLAVELPESLAVTMIGDLGEVIAGKAFDAGTEIRFEPGGGLEQLRAAWPQLSKTITAIEGTAK